MYRLNTKEVFFLSSSATGLSDKEKRVWSRSVWERYNLSFGRCNECGVPLHLGRWNELHRANGHHVIPRHFGYHGTDNCRIRCYFCETLAHMIFPENDGNIPRRDAVNFYWFRQAFEIDFWLFCYYRPQVKVLKVRKSPEKQKVIEQPKESIVNISCPKRKRGKKKERVRSKRKRIASSQKDEKKTQWNKRRQKERR